MGFTRLLRLVALTGVMLVTVAACGDQGSAPETPTPSPEAPAPSISSSPTPISAANVRACRAADLQAKIGSKSGGAGILMTSIVFENISSRACQLRGMPVVQLLDHAGNRLPTTQIKLCENAPCPPLRTVIVESQGSASVALAAVPYRSDFACTTPSAAAHSLGVILPKGDPMAVALQPAYESLTLCDDVIQVGWFH